MRVKSLAEGLLKSPEVILGKNTIYIDSINVAARPSFNPPLILRENSNCDETSRLTLPTYFIAF